MKSKKIVYVGLSVDIIHEGHINILKTASKYGEVIVGLLTDKAIASYKSIPKLSYRQREVVLKNIKYIKNVIPQKTLDYSDNLTLINDQIKIKFGSINYSKVIAVSKTFPIEEIEPLINHGHVHFGENKVQEAVDKWTNIKKTFENIQLHMIGKLQSNKTKYVLPLFDYLHSLDNKKLAEKISIEQKKLKKKIKIFIQVNIGNEEQKSGVNKVSLPNLYSYCKKLSLDVIGLMCIPPQDKSVEYYFKELNSLNKDLGLNELSMGMSADFMDAVMNSATYLRIGSTIFGKRS